MCLVNSIQTAPLLILPTLRKNCGFSLMLYKSEIGPVPVFQVLKIYVINKKNIQFSFNISIFNSKN